MPIIQDFEMSRDNRATVTITMTPPVNVNGWSIQWLLQKRFGGPLNSGLILTSMASGYYAGQSGMTMVNAQQGIFNVTIPQVATSGLNYGAYAYTTARTDSGLRNTLSEGFLVLTP